jgi:death on curing protein
MFGQEMYPSIYEKAAAYLYHLVCNHPFNDANKRTGFAVTLVFLEVNSAKQAFQKEDFENLVIEPTFLDLEQKNFELYAVN